MLVSFSPTKLTHQKPNQDQAQNAYILGNIVIIINNYLHLPHHFDYYTSNSLTLCGNTEPKALFLSGRKLIIELSTSSRFFADLQSFSQIWTLMLTVGRNLAGNSSSIHTFALKIDLWQSITLRHWDPTLSSPTRMSVS